MSSQFWNTQNARLLKILTHICMLNVRQVKLRVNFVVLISVKVWMEKENVFATYSYLFQCSEFPLFFCRCIHEYMDVYSEVQQPETSELVNSPFGGRYCGPIPPRRRISLYRALALGFYTDKNASHPELFSGIYVFINDCKYFIQILFINVTLCV